MNALAIVWIGIAVLVKTISIDLTHLGHGPDFAQPWVTMGLRAPRAAQAHGNDHIKIKRRRKW